MTKTESRRRKVVMPFDIRKKFAAAICMLLIASIMMISSSYAWFTLSTAPEVTGITTSVGANGNLEIALLTWDSFNSTADDLGIRSQVGDSMAAQSKTIANKTWGNLVDLADSSYGLDNIILNPAALNITDVATDSKTIGSTLLMAPTYGSDGRVISVDEETVIGEANGNSFTVNREFAGVRAIGVSSGITLRETSYRNALTAISTNTSNTKNAAASSLVANGPALGEILIKIAGVSDPTTIVFSKADVDVFGTVLNDLNTANGYAANAIKNAALAIVLSNANTATLTDDQVTAFVTAVNAATVDSLAAALGGSVPSELNSAITQYNKINDEITTSLNNYNSLVQNATAESTFTYAQVLPLVEALIDKEHVEVAGVENPSREDMTTLMSAAMSGGAIPIVMLDGSGVYYDIAKLAGNFTASPLNVTVNLGMIAPSMGSNDLPITASMSTRAGDPIYLTNALSAAQTAGVPTNTDGAATSLDDTYGYAIDFGFRTNAAGANLLLQQAGIQRVYNADGNESNYQGTQGQGSYMQFQSTNINTFSVDEMRALMSAVRIVFAIPTIEDGILSYEIVAIAAPEIISSVDQQSGITTYTGGTVEGTDTLKVQLALYNYAASLVNGNEVMVTLLDKKTKTEGGVEVDDVYLTDLEQNVAKKLTAIVYIDGDIVDNTMVANASTSMTGSLNLQFATDVDLVPMENTALRNGTNGDTSLVSDTIPAEITKEQLNTAITTVKGSSVYTTAQAAAEPTTQQTTLVTRVTEAEAVYNNADATPAQIKTAATNLAMAYVLAGGTNPFAS